MPDKFGLVKLRRWSWRKGISRRVLVIVSEFLSFPSSSCTQPFVSYVIVLDSLESFGFVGNGISMRTRCLSPLVELQQDTTSIPWVRHCDVNHSVLVL